MPTASVRSATSGCAMASPSGVPPAGTYTLGDADVGTQISVQVSYTDLQGTAEGPLTSVQTAAVVNINDAPTGSVTISGTPTEDQTLTASNTLADADGLGTVSVTSGTAMAWIIAGATGTTYTLINADVGATITVTASYTDGQGTAESVTSGGVGPIANVNDAPTGSVTISGTPTEDQILTACNTLADADGLGVISYQWQRDGVDIAGATASTYTLGDADVGTTITVTASYTDGQGTSGKCEQCRCRPDSQCQRCTCRRTDGHRHRHRRPAINGRHDRHLGCRRPRRILLSVVPRRRRRRRCDRPVPTRWMMPTWVRRCRCRSSYTDGQGTAEAITSAQTGAVANVNDAPVGIPAITGTVTEDQVLTADTSGISDADGLGAFSYQWYRDGVAIGGATASVPTPWVMPMSARRSVCR